MTDLTTLSASELDAQIEALNAEKARRGAEHLLPEIEALFSPPCSDADTKAMMLAALRRGMELAQMIPTPEIDVTGLLWRCQWLLERNVETKTRNDLEEQRLIVAIRETIRLLAPKRERLTDEELDLLAVEVSYNTLGKHAAALKMARLLREKGYLP